MQQFKLDLFKKENPKSIFECKTLEPLQSGKVMGMLLYLLGLKEVNNSTPDLFWHIESLESDFFKKIEYGEKGVTSKLVKSILSDLKVQAPTTIYLIWDLETNVDAFTVENLVYFWEYIWYDTLDEAIILYIPNIDYVLVITDHGYIGVFSKSSTSL